MKEKLTETYKKNKDVIALAGGLLVGSGVLIGFGYMLGRRTTKAVVTRSVNEFFDTVKNLPE